MNLNKQIYKSRAQNLEMRIIFQKSCWILRPCCHTLCRVTSSEKHSFVYLFSRGAAAQRGPWPHHHSWGFYITWRTAVGRTSLDEWSARLKEIYLTTHSTYKRQKSMPPAGFEPTTPASERQQTNALDGADTGIGFL